MSRLFSSLALFLGGFCLVGCHHPARQEMPRVNHAAREAEWRRELSLGRGADSALAYLLTQGFDCRVTRDYELARVERIVATLPSSLRDSTGEKRNWRIVITVEKDAIQSAEITPLSATR